MQKGRPLLRWAGILVVCAAMLSVGIQAWGEKEPLKAPAPGRPDLIKIAPLAASQKLELPPVTFFHDKHTAALLKEQKNCETCHLVEKGKLILTFKRPKGAKPADLKDLYHKGCIGCHTEMAAAGKKTGPLDGFCRTCHNAEPQFTPARLPVSLDKVLHYRHVAAQNISPAPGDQQNCRRCHHELDQKTQKLIYTKGKEESCRDCHLDKPHKGVKSLEQAAHQQCVQCHLDLASKGVKEPGPYVCSGCHGTEGQVRTAKGDQETVAKLKNHEVPRLMRGQPDAALITYSPKDGNLKSGNPVFMGPVAFDHQAHEKYSNNCRVCHHAAIESCDKCHTLAGSKDGNFVTFEQAMHSQTSQHSCRGCHAGQQAAAKCAGCHKHLEKVNPTDDPSCRQCHQPLPQGILAGGGLRLDNLSKLTASQKTGLALTLLKSRNLTPMTYPPGDIPEKVVIKDLSDKYKPVVLNHRQHVQALMDGMKGNALAGYFHREPGTICQGCHHNSPPAKEPPNCGSCHGVHFGAKESNRPALLPALHGQCLSCHQDMRLAKPAATACVECHAEKQK